MTTEWERMGRLAERVLRRAAELAEHPEDRPELSDDVIDRLYRLLPPIPIDQLTPELVAWLTPPEEAE